MEKCPKSEPESKIRWHLIFAKVIRVTVSKIKINLNAVVSRLSFELML